MIGDFGDESFQAIVCTGTGDQTHDNQKNTKHARRRTNPITSKLALVNKKHKNLNLNLE